jgi:hypothetical protein
LKRKDEAFGRVKPSQLYAMAIDLSESRRERSVGAGAGAAPDPFDDEVSPYARGCDEVCMCARVFQMHESGCVCMCVCVCV